MKDNFGKLIDLLQELFQLDQADLDFGIYRIMNARRDEISRFLKQDLLPQVREAFNEYKSADKALLKQELDKAIDGAKALGYDPDTAPKVKELREKYEASSVDVAGLENEVYDNLYSFFKRYYDEGDFISLRRYKEGVYAIPYEGEEVKLYWANHDQYYIKTTEYFRDYAFKVVDDHHVHFKIAEADTEKDNIKSTNGRDRRFFLLGENPVTDENGELIIRFEYQPDEQKRKQDQLNAETIRHVIELLKTEGLDAWEQRLTTKWKRADKTATDKTVLEKHLSDYTKRNTFDYFIHKDLGGFLRRELDFYIKNEVMRLDDVESESAPRVEQYLSKIKVIRRIAYKIVDFLTQIEEFQKKLWLKKKFVVETNYCITLDRIPEELYPEIAANEAQREEWVRLFAVDEIKGDMVTPAYSAPLTVEFLKANLHLVLDTRFFDSSFKAKLLESVDNIDEQGDGLLISSENFQALNLLRERYIEQVKCVYIDPPYNTDASAILYKNDYKDSSWLTLLDNRLWLIKDLIKQNGIISTAVDDEEVSGLRYILMSIFKKEIGIAVVRSNPAGRKTKGRLAPSHEYVLFFGKSEDATPGSLLKSEKTLARFPKEDDKGRFAWANFIRSGQGDRREDRPTLFYPIFVDSNDKIRIPKMEWDAEKQEYVVLEKPGVDEVAVYPVVTEDKISIEKRWQRGHKRVSAELDEFRVRRSPKGEISIDFKTRMDIGSLPVTWWENKEYASANYGAAELKDLFGEKTFDFSKSRRLVEDCLRTSGLGIHDLVIDYFAGSGTTGHAVINLNREDGGNRKYVLVEMGDYFNTVLLPRIKKVIYTKDWEEGKPVSRNTGISQMFKYLRLESYEDALANIQLTRTDAQKALIDNSASFRESYMLKYMLEAESKGSPSLLNIDRFEDPFNYQLLVGTGSVGETKPVNVDLVETFNWLLGLRVQHMKSIRGYCIVEGANPKGERVLIIWRKIRDLAEADPREIAKAREDANHDLETFFQEQQYNKADSQFDIVYVNGDNNLMNVPVVPDGGEPPYRVRLIEEEFKRLMFDVKDI